MALVVPTNPSLPDTPELELVVGPYRTLKLLGVGGMGAVYLAEQVTPIKRVVAIKLIKPGLDSAEIVRRFESERQALALMDHPNISRVIDAGSTPEGRLYFVMEYVAGIPITVYCDQHQLSIAERLRLFGEVCRAIHHAHQKGIIHRDIKPSNILVAERDGKAMPTVIDFGVAKAIDQRLEDETVFTQLGLLIGTPEYMSPEQAAASPDLDTSTDVYSLGVLLYELLTGVLPFDVQHLRKRGYLEILRVIREDDPLRPVARLQSLADSAADLAHRRRTTLGGHKKQLRGELEWIAMRALEKDRTRRYSSASAMAEDIDRHLRDEPILAGRPSRLFRLQKFVRRHRVLVTAAVLLLVAFLVGATGIAWQAREARIQRDHALTQLARATATNEFTSFLLSQAAPEGRKFSVAELLEHGEAAIEKQYRDNDAMRSELLRTVGDQYFEARHWDKATPILERARTAATRAGDPALEARASCSLALLRLLTGKREEAEELIHRALSILPDGDIYAPQRAECLLAESQFGFMTGEAEQMIKNAQAVIALQDRTPNASPIVRISAQCATGFGYYLAGNIRKAEEAYAQAMMALAAIGRDRTLIAADTLNNWALLHYRGDLTKAEPLYRRVVELHRSIEGSASVTPTATGSLGGVLLYLGHYAEAEALYRESISAANQRKDSNARVENALQLALVHIESGNLARAAEDLDELKLLGLLAQLGPYRQAHFNYVRGRLAEKRADPVAAKAAFLNAKSIYDGQKKRLVLTAMTLIGLARTELATGETQASLEMAGRALEMSQSFVEEDAPSFLVGLSLMARGDAELAQGRADAARMSYKAAAGHLQKCLGDDHPSTKEALSKASA